MSIIRNYHNHTLQTKTRPDIIIHFIKQRDQFHFERKLYAQKCMSVKVFFVTNVVVQHVDCFVFCCILDDTLHTERSILLMGDVAYDARFSVYTGHNYSPSRNVAV